MDEDVYGALVRHITIVFKSLADRVADVGGRDAESVESADFWSLDGICGERRKTLREVTNVQNGTSHGIIGEHDDETRMRWWTDEPLGQGGRVSSTLAGWVSPRGQCCSR
jgi:hypothetical protein